MAEHPLVVKSELVAKILRDETRETRQPVGHAPHNTYYFPMDHINGAVGGFFSSYAWIETGIEVEKIYAPYRVGDILWVRETWSPDHAAFYPHFPIVYRADGEIDTEKGKTFSPEANRWYPFKWRPNIHMPKRFCRLRLKITEVRCEREGDAYMWVYSFKRAKSEDKKS